jgi:hypothetical protein
MARRLSFSRAVLTLDHVAETHNDTEKGLRFYYSAPGIAYRDVKFVAYTPQEVQHELRERLGELDINAAFSTLAALEASFRTDFLVRCYERKKDVLSRHFRNVYKVRGDRVTLESDILGGWKQHFPATKALISQIIGAFRYRHWVAHGRYWMPKLGRRYDFLSVYLLAQTMHRHF